MQIHELKRKTKNRKKKIIGRGGKRGTYSGRGLKGQKARAGRKIRPEFRDQLKKIPKLRGERGRKLHSIQVKPVTINISTLTAMYEASAVVTPLDVAKKKGYRIKNLKSVNVKILGDGEIDKALIIDGCTVSDTARKKIIDAGGNIK